MHHVPQFASVTAAGALGSLVAVMALGGSLLFVLPVTLGVGVLTLVATGRRST